MRRSRRSRSSAVIIGLAALAGCATEGGGEQGGDGSADTAVPSVVSEASTAATDPPTSDTTAIEVIPATSPPTVVEPECREAATGPTTFAYADRAGVDPNLTSVDVYLPAGCGPVPVVMWVHGGGWQRGDKSGANVERKAAWAESLGAALVSVNYRLSTPGSGVMWPDHGDDVAAASPGRRQREQRSGSTRRASRWSATPPVPTSCRSSAPIPGY